MASLESAADVTVLGMASRYGEDRLKATFVVVSTFGPTLEVLGGWHGTRRTDLASQLADLYQVIRNRSDATRPQALAIKRAESPPSRPPGSYDSRVSLEAVVMLAAEHLGCRHFAYRTREMKGRFGGQEPPALVHRIFPSCPAGEEAVEATAAACAALRDLGHEIEL